MNNTTFASLYYCYDSGCREILIDGAIFELTAGNFEKKVVYRLLEQLRNFAGCRLQCLSGDYGEAFSLPSYVNNVETEEVFVESSLSKFDKVGNLIKEEMASSVFSNVYAPYNFENLDTTSIVCNSGEILNSKKRGEIESNDCIVRLNNAPCSGFEEDVGKKTTFRFVNNMLSKGKSIKGKFDLKSLNKLLGRRLIFDVQDKDLEFEIRKKLAAQNELYFISEAFAKEIRGLTENYNLENLSSGLKATLLFGALSNEVEVFGMSFYSNLGSSLHYWEDLSNREVDKTHNWEKEKEVFQFLQEDFDVNLVES